MTKDATINGIEALKESAVMKLGREFPSLYYDRLVVVDPRQTRILLDDVTANANADISGYLEYLALACKGELQVFNVGPITVGTVNRLEKLIEVSGRKKTALLFPGNGAKIVKQFLLQESDLTDMTMLDIPTERKVNAQTNAVEGVTVRDVTQGRKTLADAKTETIIVVDDAIATGATLAALQEAFPGRKIGWNAVALLALSPIQRRAYVDGSQSGVVGVANIVAPILYQGTSGIPAVNSLSTLIGNSEKSQAVRARYIQDFVEDREMFEEAIEGIRMWEGDDENFPRY